MQLPQSGDAFASPSKPNRMRLISKCHTQNLYWKWLSNLLIYISDCDSLSRELCEQRGPRRTVFRCSRSLHDHARCSLTRYIRDLQMQIAITTAKEDGLQIRRGNSVQDEFSARSCASSAGLRTFPPLQNACGTNIRWVGVWQWFVLELDAPIIFRDVSWLADAKRSGICGLACALAWASRIIAGYKEQRCENY